MPTDAERIAALEAEVSDLKTRLAKVEGHFDGVITSGAICSQYVSTTAGIPLIESNLQP